MPLYLKQWIDGDFTIVSAADLNHAVRLFETIACVDPRSVKELSAGDLCVTVTLDDQGHLRVSAYAEAIEEARRLCYPALMKALNGRFPGLVDAPKIAAVAAAVNDELKVRSESKLTRRLRRERDSR